MIILVLGIIAFLVVYVWLVYNHLATIRTRIGASIQEIGNQLKRQTDLIPNLTASVKGYMKHEKEVFEKITEARKVVSQALTSQNARELLEASEKMQAALAPVRVLFESTPQLQAAGPTTKLMDELRDTADKVMYARRTLIDLSADFNVKLVTFPSNLLAKIFGFKPEKGLETSSKGEHLEVSSEEAKTPRVEL